MKTKTLLRLMTVIFAAAFAVAAFAACGDGKSESENAKAALETVKNITDGATAVPDGATHITAEITIDKPGDYYVNSALDGKITVASSGVTLYLSGATMTNGKKIVDSTYDMTITLIGENSMTNSNTEGSNAIDCTGALVINGDGSLSIDATKNGIKAESISVVGATLDINADKDGLHAEVDAYDDATEKPSPAYSDGGFVYLKDAKVTAVTAEDGITADSFVYISGDSEADITAGGGAPATVTADSAAAASGKGIKVGPIDWGANGTDIEDWNGYLIYIDGGSVNINSNDDALHSDSEILIKSGEITVSCGNKGINANGKLTVSGGKVSINKCFEDVDAGEKDIADGTIAK